MTMPDEYPVFCAEDLELIAGPRGLTCYIDTKSTRLDWVQALEMCDWLNGVFEVGDDVG